MTHALLLVEDAFETVRRSSHDGCGKSSAPSTRVLTRRSHGTITTFDSLFAAHIHMDNVGDGGTAVNDRRFGNESVYVQEPAVVDGRVGFGTSVILEEADGRRMSYEIVGPDDVEPAKRQISIGRPSRGPRSESAQETR